MIELLGTVATLGAIAGVVLNNFRDRRCFLIWIGTNAITLSLHVSLGVWSLAARDLAFLALAVHGWRKWGKT